MQTSPACARAVLQTVEALRKQGHELVEWQPLNVYKALKVALYIRDKLIQGLCGTHLG